MSVISKMEIGQYFGVLLYTRSIQSRKRFVISGTANTKAKTKNTAPKIESNDVNVMVFVGCIDCVI